MGHSVWQTEDPDAVVSTLNRIVHDDDAPEAVWPGMLKQIDEMGFRPWFVL